jgi:hypothetical protein
VEGDGFDGSKERDGGIELAMEEGGEYEFDVGWE